MARIISEGEEFSSEGRKRVAISKIRLTLPDESSVERAIDEIKKSDVILKAKPANERLYDWTLAAAEGQTISFGVAWYDIDFFKEKKNVYTTSSHEEIFKRIGVTPNAFLVEHFVKEG